MLHALVLHDIVDAGSAIDTQYRAGTSVFVVAVEQETERVMIPTPQDLEQAPQGLTTHLYDPAGDNAGAACSVDGLGLGFGLGPGVRLGLGVVGEGLQLGDSDADSVDVGDIDLDVLRVTLPDSVMVTVTDLDAL